MYLIICKYESIIHPAAKEGGKLPLLSEQDEMYCEEYYKCGIHMS